MPQRPPPRRVRLDLRRPHPIDSVDWVKPSTLSPNLYNPNRVFPPELELLELSIVEDGWTQPIVASKDGMIVDGFHRWQLATRSARVIEVSSGLCPVVRVQGLTLARAMAATVRHNRARGQHGILAMGEIVRRMQAEGMTPEQVCTSLGMEDEELERLAEMRPAPERIGQESFGAGWVPAAPERK